MADKPSACSIDGVANTVGRDMAAVDPGNYVYDKLLSATPEQARDSHAAARKAVAIAASIVPVMAGFAGGLVHAGLNCAAQLVSGPSAPLNTPPNPDPAKDKSQQR